MKPKFRIWFCTLAMMCMLSILHSSCKKHDDAIAEGDPFKVIAIAPLTDKIPYQILGAGKIVFQRIGYSEEGFGFYVVDIDKKTSSGFKLNSLAMEPNISPDGTRIACSLLSSASWKSEWNIYIMNIDGSHCFPIFDQWSSYPTWTPDGSKVLFYLNSANEGQLNMQSPVENATDRVMLTKFYYGDDPTWIIMPRGGFSISPEQKLVCVSNGGVETSGILSIVPFIGKSGVTRLMSFSSYPGFESPVFSPDGKKIAFLSIELNTDFTRKAVIVNIMNPDGSNITQLARVESYKTPSPYIMRREVSLCWAPDGSKILFTVPKEEYGGHLFVINSDGSGLTQVTDNVKAYDNEVSWSR